MPRVRAFFGRPFFPVPRERCALLPGVSVAAETGSHCIDGVPFS
jgi:hypothetical protein